MSPKLAARLCRLVQRPRILLYRWLSSGRVQGRPRLRQPLQTAGHGEIRFDGEVTIGVFPSPRFLSSYAYIEARSAAAQVVIGDGTMLNNDFCAIAEHSRITLGRRVLAGTGVEILDSDFHGLAVADRQRSDPADARPVVIEDDVFLGSNVRVLKGVTIGRGAVIANGSIVLTDIPAGVIAAGVPARVIRPIDPPTLTT
jgi:maltose O-acetyltransferase